VKDIINNSLLDTDGSDSKKRIIPEARRRRMLKVLGSFPSDRIPVLLYFLNKSPRCDVLLHYLLDSGRVGKELHEWIGRDFGGDVHRAAQHLLCLNTGTLLG
jgi:hypothetical protein